MEENQILIFHGLSSVLFGPGTVDAWKQSLWCLLHFGAKKTQLGKIATNKGSHKTEMDIRLCWTFAELDPPLGNAGYIHRL